MSNATLFKEVDKDASIEIKLDIKEETGCSTSDSYAFTVLLRSKECRGNGLVQFEYELSDADCSRFDNIKDKVYHLIKEHFHIHTHHDYYQGVSKGYYPDTLIELQKKDNDAIKFYLKQIYQILKNQLKQVEYDYEELVKTSGLDNESVRKARYDFYRGCDDIFGQFVYYNSLIESKWNRSCRRNPEGDGIDEKMKQVFHNISNIMERLRALYRKSRSTFYVNKIHENSSMQLQIRGLAKENSEMAKKIESLSEDIKKSLEASDCTNNISLGLGLLSVVLALYFGIYPDGFNHDSDTTVKSEEYMPKDSVFTGDYGYSDTLDVALMGTDRLDSPLFRGNKSL